MTDNDDEKVVVNDADFRAACELAFEYIMEHAPYDTGNLALNALKIEFPYPWKCVIYVDETIAPYMKYTNEHWEHKLIKMGNFRPGEVVERMRTWDNPNEGWWNKVCEEAIAIIQDLLGGELTTNGNG
jgi:hypothetical protein